MACVISIISPTIPKMFLFFFKKNPQYEYQHFGRFSQLIRAPETGKKEKQKTPVLIIFILRGSKLAGVLSGQPAKCNYLSVLRAEAGEMLATFLPASSPAVVPPFQTCSSWMAAGFKIAQAVALSVPSAPTCFLSPGSGQRRLDTLPWTKQSSP